MKRFTRHLLICTAIAATLFTATVSAANSKFTLQIPNGSSLTTSAEKKDDSEGRAYITPSYAESSERNAVRAWVVDHSGRQITNAIYLKSGKKMTVTYNAGTNLPDSYYNLEVSYVANPQVCPATGLVTGVWCP